MCERATHRAVSLNFSSLFTLLLFFNNCHCEKSVGPMCSQMDSKQEFVEREGGQQDQSHSMIVEFYKHLWSIWMCSVLQLLESSLMSVRANRNLAICSNLLFVWLWVMCKSLRWLVELLWAYWVLAWVRAWLAMCSASHTDCNPLNWSALSTSARQDLRGWTALCYLPQKSSAVLVKSSAPFSLPNFVGVTKLSPK